MAPILTIFGPNRSQRRNLFFEKFSNERRRHRGIVVVVVIVAVVVAVVAVFVVVVVGRFWVACIKGTSLVLSSNPSLDEELLEEVSSLLLSSATFSLSESLRAPKLR